ncbi:hypothetical protein DFR31_1574 [Alkalispirillum mobile]|uniref:Heparinase II/III-like protein n=1 Tax=Alkalispirillum mobile TaxID=85925 RepID=A0A498CE71_9GAMM|nr:hypothetical protein DFR31_1574 [Alkalispirillum mobile]
MVERFSRCQDLLTDALREQVRPGVGLWDPLRAGPTPPDHYGNTSAALALLLSRGGPDPMWQEPLGAWLGLAQGRIGHAPFNRFLLNLIAGVPAAREVGSGRALLAGRNRCRLQRHYPSNNWRLLAQLCQLIEAETTWRRQRALDNLLSSLDRWLTSAGGFIDFPARPQKGTLGATPIAYHHKALFVTTVAACFVDSSKLSQALQRMLDWALSYWDGAGHAGGYGRSTHSLFGDACLVASLRLLGVQGTESRPTGAGQVLDGVLARWEAQRRSDGLIGLTPADGESAGQSGWDNYMYLSVYNAWAAAILAWAEFMRVSGDNRPGLSDIRWPDHDKAVGQDQEAGLMCIKGHDGLRVFLSTRGQTPQAFSRTHAELRYAGGVPFHVNCERRVLCPPTLRIARDDLLARPAMLGWTPVFRVQGELWGLTDYALISVREDDSGVQVVLEGVATALLRPEPITFWQRFFTAVDWRLGGNQGRRSALRRGKNYALSARLTFSVARTSRRVAQELVLHQGESRPVEYLNPGGHALVAIHPPAQREISFSRIGPAQGEAPFHDAKQDVDEVPVDAAIGHAVGCAMRPAVLPPGAYRQRLVLAW